MAFNNQFLTWFGRFGKTVYFDALVSLLMISFIWIQIVNTYSIWNYNSYYSSFASYSSLLEQKTQSMLSRVDYINSADYKDEDLKNQGYKYPNEQVWELNQKEVARTTKNQLDMIKYPTQSEFGNLDRWLLCLNLTDRGSFWLELEAKKAQLLLDKDQNKPVLKEGDLCKKNN
jgi:hypothetical protein